MYNNNTYTRVDPLSSDMETPQSFAYHLPHLTIPDQLASGIEFDSVHEAIKALGYPEASYSSGSTCCSSGGSCYSSPSFVSQKPSLIQRSISSLSLLHRNNNVNGYHCNCPFESTREFIESEMSPVRRVCSTGDLQRINGGSHYSQRAENSTTMSESNMIIEGMMTKACRYSPEEKKERIERYRSKRTQRNFNKKIKYACRKTLADSRPRIRGRFARNDEIERSPQIQWPNHFDVEEDDQDEDDNWTNFLNAFSSGNLAP